MKRATALLLLVFMLVVPTIQSNSKSEFLSSYHPNSANPVVPPRNASHGSSVPISSCGVLDSPGTTYSLSNDISGGLPSGPGINTCFLITQNGITLNLNGFRIDA